MILRNIVYVLASVLVSLVLGLQSAWSLTGELDRDYSHPGIMAGILKQQLEGNHFSKKKFDDALSQHAFELYVKQIDHQKMFLLGKDIQRLRAYAELIDDEMRSGKLGLPALGAEILVARVKAVEPVVKEILSKDFDVTEKEYLETDPDKREYCATEEELKDRWRKVLKYQVLSRLLGLPEEEKSGKEPRPEQQEPGETQKEARGKVLKSYETLFSRMVKEKKTEPFDRYFRAVTRAFDPHTEFMPPRSKEDFDIHMKGSLEGIGATLREDDGYIKVEALVPGGPAQLQGSLKAGDRIIKVAEGDGEPVDIVGMRVSDAVRLIRGSKGTVVRLTVLKPNGVELVFPITRNVVQIEETFARASTLQGSEGSRSVGYIQLPTFYRDFGSSADGPEGRNSTDDVRKELRKLRAANIEGLILDLRGNGGGALTDAVNIAGLFIASGPVVQVKDGRGRVSVLGDNDPGVEYEGPLVVLVNRYSASASEILAGALQDYGRAVVVGGDHTYGKGTVQSIIGLSDSLPPWQRVQYGELGALKLTIQKFYRVTGDSTQHRGVVSDIVLPDMLEDLKSGERYLDFALPWDTIAPAAFEKSKRGGHSVEALKSRSTRRVQSIEDFRTIAEEGRKYGELLKRTLQPLNLEELRTERDETKRMRDTLAKSMKRRDADQKKDESANLSPEERHGKWVAEISSDPYVREAAAILMDMLVQEAAPKVEVTGARP